MESWYFVDGWTNYGPVGYNGRTGMYVPTWLVEAYPSYGFDFWRFFLNPEALKIFETRRMDPQVFDRDGSYICDEIYHGCQQGRYYPSFYPQDISESFMQMWMPNIYYSEFQYERLIEGLHLNASINYLGENMLDYVDMALSNDSAVMFYAWYPTTFVATRNVTRVMFPDPDGGKVDFAYSTQSAQNMTVTTDESAYVLHKDASKAFSKDFPDLYSFFTLFTLLEWDMTLMLRNMTVYNISANEQACNWIHDNMDRWTPWIPPPPVSHDSCPIGTGRYLEFGLPFCLECPSGYFNWDNATTGPCLPCPLNAICPGGATINVVSGHWINEPNMTFISELETALLVMYAAKVTMGSFALSAKNQPNVYGTGNASIVRGRVQVFI
ncbi:hypothetical protein HDU76_013931 [Blyttiomyces sp. JEL0837]|nr:hypothetical protein HDU76_013931 [Blyttiomyces sp. JEL0837]